MNNIIQHLQHNIIWQSLWTAVIIAMISYLLNSQLNIITNDLYPMYDNVLALNDY